MAGEQQSPIHLRATIRAAAPDNHLQLSWPDEVVGFRHDGPHGVEVLFGTSPNGYLELDGKRFHLRQFHFHHPGEHILDATTFDGEVHLVHQNLDDLSFAVIGIFLRVDEAAAATEEASRLAEAFLLSRDRSAPPPTETRLVAS